MASEGRLNDPPQTLEGPSILHEMIDWERFSSRCALDFTINARRQRYTYQELQDSIVQLLSRIPVTIRQDIHQADTTRQHIVPILLPQSPGLYVSQFAVLQSGGAFCPINLDAPKDRIAFLVEDVKAAFIITTLEFKDRLPESCPAVILVDEFPVPPIQLPEPKQSVRTAASNDLAYVIYTSGSTGNPKGVEISHLAVTQSLLAHQRHIPTFKRFLQFASPSFDVSVFETFFPLIRGCTLVGCERTELLNDLPKVINDLNVDAAELTPTIVGSLIQKRANVPGLKLLLTIGEMLTRPIVKEFGGSEDRVSILYGMYGPTEAAIHCTISPKMRANLEPGNIGVPLDTVSAFVASAESNNLRHHSESTVERLPSGELGELVLGGPQLAKGYLNRDAENAASFLALAGKRYYRTGDRARLLQDGSIEILGRINAGQVKLRGQRVELGEIENAVYRHPSVRTVSATIMADVLVAFALTRDKAVTVSSVREICAKWLPTYMIPREMILLENFPYLPSGKIDKRKLEADFEREQETSQDEEGPPSPTKQTVRAVAIDILGQHTSSTRLAAVGLDSLNAIRLAGKLRASGYNVAPVALLQCETIRSLVELCEQADRGRSSSTTEATTDSTRLTTVALNGCAKDVEIIMPCTPLQDAMLAETAIDHKAYRNWIEMELTGAIDLEQVQWALHELAERTPMLRTGFMESHDGHGYAQMVWRQILHSQSDEVERLNYDFDVERDVSLHRPVRFQLLQLRSSIRVLMHIHHALYDAWSIELLLDDLDACLTECIAGDPGPPSTAPISNDSIRLTKPLRPSFKLVVDGYVDGTLLPDAPSSHQYWKDHLSNASICTLPNFHYAETPAPGLAVTYHTTTIATMNVEQIARRMLVSPQSLFQAAYALVLSSYLGSSDICFGAIVSGRTLSIAGIEDIIGPCVTTLPVRVDLSTSTTLHEIVRELSSTTRKHLEYSSLPLRDIKAHTNTSPRQPLFDTLFIWQQTLHGYDHTRKHVSLVDSVDNLEFNLTLEVVPGLGNVCLKATYQQSLFPCSQIEALLHQVEHVARQAMDSATHAVSSAFDDLDQRLSSIANPQPDGSMPDVTLTSEIEEVALHDPDRSAIAFAKSLRRDGPYLEVFTYAELNTRANQIGHCLVNLGCQANELVCICLEKGIDLYSSILATIKVGAAYLPLTPEVPVDRLYTTLQEAGIKIVVTSTVLRNMFEVQKQLTVIYVDELALTKYSSQNIRSSSTSLDDLAYCIFTSGSTGKPKGVMVTRRNLLSNLTVLEELYPTSNDTRLLQSCSQAFDVSVFEIFFTWRIGGCLCAGNTDDVFRDIEHAIRVLKVTHLSLTPTVAGLINPEKVPKVQFLVTAGEALTRKVLNTWAGKGLYQGYGPSETTNICTLRSNVTYLDNINNIGKAFRNTSAFVLSDEGTFTIAPQGGEGELVFGGSQVYRGYLNKSQEVGRIIKHPIYGRLYRSGDYGRMLTDGSLAYTRRKDDQIKIRGQRVELGEINSILQQCNEVTDCVTLVCKISDGAQRLISFWTSAASLSTTSRCIKLHESVLTKLYDELSRSLPSYMIPSALISVSALPMTALGKLDRRRLEAMSTELGLSYINSMARTSRSAPEHIWNDLELKIVHALVQTLRIEAEDIGPDTSFFTLGLDSISAISLARYLRESTEKQVEISEVLRNNTVIRLAETCASKDYALTGSEDRSESSFEFGFSEDFLDSVKESFQQAGRTVQSVLPCTALQDAMLSATQISSKKAYVNHTIFEIHSSLERLRDCWIEMVGRHQILRTCFMSTDLPRHANVQVVLENFEPEWTMLNVKTDDDSLIITNIEAQFTIADFEPPYMFRVVETPSKKQKLALSMHHALYDGVAMSILYEEIEKAYRHQGLPPAISFEPYLQSMASLNLDAADKFWEENLKCYTAKPIHVHQPYLETESSPTIVYRCSATVAFTWVEEQVRSLDTSLLAVCHAVWTALLSEQQHASDICFGNVVNGRHLLLDGMDRLVAPCFNTIPIRLQHTHQLSYLEAIRRLQHIQTTSLPFHTTPLRRIQSKFRPDGSRLFDTLFILQHPARTLDPSIWSMSEDTGVIDFPLVFGVVPKHSDDTLDFILQSNSSYTSTEEAKSILSLFDFKLREGLENPRRQLLSTAVKEQILRRRSTDLPTEGPLKQLGALEREMTPPEVLLRDIICPYTDVPLEKIGRTTSIFKLGLDSINSVQVASRLKSEGHDVRASDILQHPTIAKLAAHLKTISTSPWCDSPTFDFKSFDRKHRSSVLRRHNVTGSAVEAIRPCTPVQHGMIAQSLHSETAEYWNSVYLNLEPSLGLPEFQEAWKAVIRQHEMLRTGFVSINDEKYPFAMITFNKDQYILLWHSGTSSLSKDLLHPWCLTIIKEGANICIQFQAHHAIYDAQSMQMILSDVARHCTSKTIIARPSIVPLLHQILVESEDDAQSKTFWESEGSRMVLHKFPDLTPLHVTNATFVCEKTSELSLWILEAKCRQHEITTQTATQVAWARLLSAYVGEPRVTFGVTLSGRSIHSAANETSFPSIVTLPVTCDLAGKNLDVLTQNLHLNAQLHKHQFTPLRSIQRWAGSADSKLFDTLFLYQKLTTEQDEADRPWKIVKEEARVEYAVSMEIEALPSGDITLRLSTTTKIMPEDHARLILDQYDALLLDTLENPRAPCSGAPSLRPELLSITPAKDPKIESPVSLLHEFIDVGAFKWPNKTALEFTTYERGDLERRSWTYTELDKQSNRIARLLTHHGIMPGQIIAICFDKCAEASFAIIGILKAGCAYVALDPNAPHDRLAFILKDSDARLILSAGNVAQRIGNAEDELTIDLTRAALDEYSSEAPNLARQIRPQDICYCLYTSGTTGLPKGCLISHESAVQAMLSFQRLFTGHWNENSKWLQFASFHFDVSVVEQFWSWSVGICVASAPRDLIFEDIPSAINCLGITHIDLTPSLARLLHPDDVPALCKGVFITGGEQLKQDILDVWGDKLCIYNGYGPTEATIGVTMYPRVPRDGRPANIGPQFDNVGSYVLMPNTEAPVLRGGVGELAVSGKLVGKGYLNRPELTAERFPTLEKYRERVYRTGDLVRILHDGSFIFLGRADDQVKLRGQRLELGEINEVVKKSHTNIQEVVTLLMKHKTLGKEHLVSFFVASSKIWDLIPAIKSSCKSRLPGYMVPTHFVSLDAIPLNVNNKADFKQLSTLYNEVSLDELQCLQTRTQDPQWSEAEKRILGSIADYLGIDSTAIGRDTSVFELGLDSISIIGFAYALQNAGFHNARLSLVKDNPIISELIKVLVEACSLNDGKEANYFQAKQNIAAFSQKHSTSICKDLGIDSSDVEAIAPATPVQQGMIYRFLESDGPVYFHTFNFGLHDHVDDQRFMAAWCRMGEKLQILRTKFVTTDDGYAQVVLRSFQSLADGYLLDYTSTEKSLALAKPYSSNLTKSPEGDVFCLKMFHGLYDGNSLDMMLDCLIREYHGKEAVDYGPSFHESLSFGPLTMSAGAEAFWKDHLKDWRHHPMPQSTDPNQTIMARMDVNVLDGFESLRRKLGFTPQVMIQAIWLSLLQKILSPSLTIGLVISGRAIDFAGAERVIGPLFNTVPFYIKLAAGSNMSALIQECHKLNLRIQEYQNTPLKDIQKWSPAGPGQALFDNLFVFQRSNPRREQLPQGFWTELADRPGIDDYPLALEATLNKESTQLQLLLVTRDCIMSQTAADDLLQNFRYLFQSTLQESGNNIVPVVSNDGSHVPASFAVTVPEDYDTNSNKLDVAPEQIFHWTTKAQQIRIDIATLANVTEDRIDEHTSIYEVGLDSIDVIKLASRLRKGGIEIPVSTIIRCQSVASIYDHIRLSEIPGEDSGRTIQRITQQILQSLGNDQLYEDYETILPATPLQQTMYNEMIKSHFRQYFTVEAFEVTKGVDTDRLVVAIQEVVAQSPILRTSFVEVSDPDVSVSYAQAIQKSWYDLKRLQEISEVEEMMDSIRNEANEDQKLFKVALALIDQRQYLFIAISHALYDGTSLRVFHQDIRSAYAGTLESRPDPTLFLEKVLNSTTQEAEQFWRSTLSDLPPAKLPRKSQTLTTSAEPVHRLERQSLVLLNEAESLCRRSRISMQTLGQTCWALVLAEMMGQLDVVFGCVLSCRDTEEASQVMFPLMNTVVVRSVLHGNLVEMLRYMQGMNDATRQYQHFPLGKAQAIALTSRAEQSGYDDTVLFDTLFIYQGRREPLEAETLYTSVQGSSNVKLPVCVEMEIVDDQLLWTAACKSPMSNSCETADILANLDVVLQRVIAKPDSPTIDINSEGVSVCGLSRFQLAQKATDKTTGLAKPALEKNWSNTELSIRGALHELSGVDDESIRRDSTIFHLGLDSISALKLPALLRKQGINISVSDILKHPTIRAMTQLSHTSESKHGDALMANNIDFTNTLAGSVPQAPVSKALKEHGISTFDIAYVMPVTSGQLYMIRRWQGSGGSLFYFSFTYELSEDFDQDRLQEAWSALLQRHDILRTAFVEVGSKILQVVYKEAPTVTLRLHDGRPKVESGRLYQLPLRLFFEDNAAAPKLVLHIHHALYDGISLPILINELQALYNGEKLEAANINFKQLVAKSISANQQSVPDGSDQSEIMTWQLWTSYLQPGPSLLPAGSSDQPKRIEVFEPSLPMPSLKSIARSEGVSTDSLLLATVSKLYAAQLQDITTASEIDQAVTIGIYLANRAPFGQDISSLAAPTLNILPICVKRPSTTRIEELAKTIQKDLQKIQSKEMVFASLEEIYQWTGVTVNFCVNILKGRKDDDGLGYEQGVFRQVEDLIRKAKEVDVEIDENVEFPKGGKCDAYLPSVDMEIGYKEQEGKGALDIGLFGPSSMISISDAGKMIEEFLCYWS